MKKTIVFWALISSCLICISLFVFWSHKGFFNIQEVIVDFKVDQQQESLFKDDLEKINFQLSQFENKSLWTLSLDDIAQQLKTYSWISGVKLIRRWPRQLLVLISAHPVKALLWSSSDQIIPVFANGDLMHPMAIHRVPDLPLMRGALLENPTHRDEREKTLQFINKLPQKGKLSLQNLAEITYQSPGLFWLSLLPSGVTVWMKDENISTTAYRVNQVLDYLNEQKVKGRVIDARFEKKVLVRLRKQQ